MTMSLKPLAYVLISQLTITSVISFTTPRVARARRQSPSLLRETPNDQDDVIASQNRRYLLASIITLSTLIPNQAEAAVDPLFRPNPLTNPILEQIRINDQAYADNIKYGGELAPGSPKGREQYAKLLLPVLAIDDDIRTLSNLLLVNDDTPDEPLRSRLSAAKTILDKPQFTKLEFKKIFNAFADNIYYSDPDRANLYLGGGATPKTEQSIAYLYRNDILTNVENLRAEVDYLIKSGEDDYGDLKNYVTGAKDGMSKYLELVPPQELEMARKITAS